MLSIKNLSKCFGNNNAVDNVSFNVETGKIFGLLGPNGAGKSTILRLILNIMTPDAGSISFINEQNTKFSLDNIGYLPEERGLYQRSKVVDVLKYFGRLKSLDNKQLNSNITTWSEKLDLSGYLKKNVYELSKGNQQKVQFLVSILHNPIVIILDEPFSGFDPLNQQLILEIISQFENEGKIILISTHLLELAEKFCREIVLINNGRKIISGNINEMKSNYSTNIFSAKFNGEINKIDKIDLIETVEFINGEFKITASNKCKPDELLSILSQLGNVVEFKKCEPTLSEIFIESVTQSEN